MSIGAFARFGIADVPSFQSNWQALHDGSDCHIKEQEYSKNEYKNVSFEIPITGSHLTGLWRINLDGRMDQLIRADDRIIIREIKSTHTCLPLPDSDLQEIYLHYFNQLAAYLVLSHGEWVSNLNEIEKEKLLRQNASFQRQIEALPFDKDDTDATFLKTPLIGELVFINITDQTRQTVTMSVESAQEFLNEQATRLIPFLENRWMHRSMILGCTVPDVFTEYREGQSVFIDQLRETIHIRRIHCIEAPTGFGKTGLILQVALEYLANGNCDRILYVSSKATGQLQVVKQLEAWGLSQKCGIRHFCLRNQAEHEIPSAPLRAFNHAEIAKRWNLAAIDLPYLICDEPVSIEKLQYLGNLTGVPPYLISLALLPYAEIWVCDYNYLLSPNSIHILNTIAGYDPSQTLLIVDEAHNLPSRVADVHTVELKATIGWLLLDALRLISAPPDILRMFETLVTALDGLKANSDIDGNTEDDFNILLHDLADASRNRSFNFFALNDWGKEFFWETHRLSRTLSRLSLPHHTSCPENGTLRCDCLSGAEDIANVLNSFNKSILMSATLPPMPLFAEDCGVSPQEINVIYADAPWHENAFDIAIDLRVDTRLKSRERFYAMTAETIIACLSTWELPIVVFFPSYEYADTIHTYIQASDSLSRIAVQPKGLSLSVQSTFIEESLLTQDAIFLILGSSFAESVDMLGGRIRSAIVVSSALPKVNALQEVRMDRLAHLGRDDAFERIFIIPAMRKIRQAIGRLVRAPGHTARILLHDKRFAEINYLKHLKPASPPQLLNTTEDFECWIHGSR